MQLTGGEIVVESLIRAGVPYAIGIPGHGILGLQDAFLGREDRIRCLSAKQEASAVHMADGYFRVSGRPLAVFTSIGPGAINTATGLATSFVDSTAVLCITGATHTYMVGKGVLQEIERGRRGHAFPNVIQPIVKRQWCVTSPQQLATVMERAFVEMLTGRKGPVHIDLPMDVQAESADVDLPERITVPESWTTPPVGDIQRAADMLRTAKRPVILAGGGVLSSGASNALLKLAEATGAAVATTFQGKSAFPNNHPLSVWLAGSKGTHVGLEFCRKADVLLAVGCRFADETAASYRHGVSFSIPPTQLIHIDVDPREIGKNYPATVGLVGDARRTLDKIREAFEADGGAVDWRTRPYTADIARARAAWDAYLASLRQDDREPAVISSVLAETREFLDDDAIVVSSSGNTQAQILQEFPFHVAGTNVTTGGFSTMGFALPAALGAKLAAPDRQVIAICGDGDFLMAMHELATAVEHDIPAVVLVCNNRGWISIRDLQMGAYGEERAINTDFVRRDGESYSPNLATIAEAFGCHAQRIRHAGEVQTALAAAFASEQPALIECEVSRDYPHTGAPAVGWWDVPVPTYLEGRRREYEDAREEERV